VPYKNGRFEALLVALLTLYGRKAGHSLTATAVIDPPTRRFSMVYRIYPVMSRILLALVASFLTAATLSADVADLQASALPPDGPVALGREFRVTFKVHNGGPNVAHHVRALFTVPPGVTNLHSGSPWFACSGPDCRYDYVAPDQTLEIYFYASAPAAVGRFTIGMTLTADESDPNPADNAASMDVEAVAQPELGFWFTTAMQDAPPDSIRTVTFEPINAGAPANAVVTIDLPAGGRFLQQLGDSTFTCELAGSRATCRAPSFAATLPNHPQTQITLRFANPPLYEGGYVEATATITSDAVDLDPRNDHASIPWFIPKLFAVTNGEDSGPGSLRQAILDANADCPLRCVVTSASTGRCPRTVSSPSGRARRCRRRVFTARSTARRRPICWASCAIIRW
jgi:hypothetical protein